MDANNTLTPSLSLLFFVSFVIHFTTVLFIAAIYGFAFRFLGDRSYIPIAIGWFLNACYIGLEAILMMVHIDEHKALSLGLFTAGLGIVSMPFFYLSTQSLGSKESHRIRYSYLVGTLLVMICIGGAFWTYDGTSRIPSPWIFVIFTLPPAIYSAFVLISVAHKFFLQFPEDDYGSASRVLYGSWAAYGILQFFYPFKGFLENQRIVFTLLFSIAFAIKVLSSGSLLSMLRESYNTVQSEIREASVLGDIGNVAAGLHHDIANPLAWVDSELSLLAQKRSNDEIVTRAVAKIRKPVGLIDSAIKFVSSIRADPEAIAREFKRISTKSPITLAISTFKKRNPNAPMRIIAPDEEAPVYYIRANSDLLSEAFVNIFNNALEASAKVLRIRVRRVLDHEPKVQFIFTNDGKLLTKEERENCLKPGWSSKEMEDLKKANVGMGLYMCTKLISIHRGTFKIENTTNGKAVEAIVSIPAARHIAEKEKRKEKPDNE